MLVRRRGLRAHGSRTWSCRRRICILGMGVGVKSLEGCGVGSEGGGRSGLPLPRFYFSNFQCVFVTSTFSGTTLCPSLICLSISPNPLKLCQMGLCLPSSSFQFSFRLRVSFTTPPYFLIRRHSVRCHHCLPWIFVQPRTRHVYFTLLSFSCGFHYRTLRSFLVLFSKSSFLVNCLLVTQPLFQLDCVQFFRYFSLSCCECTPFLLASQTDLARSESKGRRIPKDEIPTFSSLA